MQSLSLLSAPDNTDLYSSLAVVQASEDALLPSDSHLAPASASSGIRAADRLSSASWRRKSPSAAAKRPE